MFLKGMVMSNQMTCLERAFYFLISRFNLLSYTEPVLTTLSHIFYFVINNFDFLYVIIGSLFPVMGQTLQSCISNVKLV